MIPCGCGCLWVGIAPCLTFAIAELGVGPLSGTAQAITAQFTGHPDDGQVVAVVVLGGLLIGFSLLGAALSKVEWVQEGERPLRVRRWGPFGGWVEQAISDAELREQLEVRAAVREAVGDVAAATEWEPDTILDEARSLLTHDDYLELEDALRRRVGLDPLSPRQRDPAPEPWPPSAYLRLTAAAWVLSLVGYAALWDAGDAARVAVVIVFSTAAGLSVFAALARGGDWADRAAARWLDPFLRKFLG